MLRSMRHQRVLGRDADARTLLDRAGVVEIGTGRDAHAALGDLQVERAVQALCEHTGQAQVALVGHSMGGLAIRAWMRTYGTKRAALAVTLGTPHQGTQVSPQARASNGKQMVWQSEWLAALAGFKIINRISQSEPTVL